MDYIEIVDWEDTQHYSDRNPPWIKLQETILDDYRFMYLPDNQKLILFSLMLLANKTRNKIPKDINWIRQKTNLKCRIDFDPLLQVKLIRIQNNGLPDANIPIAKRYQGKPKSDKETYGQFSNVFLTKDEHLKLVTQFGNDGVDQRIDNLSHYVESKGRQYRSHYATILMWEAKHKRDKEEPKLFDHRTICRVCKKPKSPLIDGTCTECRTI